MVDDQPPAVEAATARTMHAPQLQGVACFYHMKVSCVVPAAEDHMQKSYPVIRSGRIFDSNTIPTGIKRTHDNPKMGMTVDDNRCVST